VAEQVRMDAIGEKVMKATAKERFWWEAELPEFAWALQRLRDNVKRRADKLSSAAAPPLQ
jgi:pheromone receptor transcription factor